MADVKVINFSSLTPVQIKYVSLGLKAFLDKYINKGLDKVKTVTIDTPIYNFASASILYNNLIYDKITCIPCAAQSSIAVTINDQQFVNDDVFGPIYGFNLFYTFSVAPSGVVTVKTETLVRLYIGDRTTSVAHTTLTDVVIAASIEIFKQKLGSSNITELPSPILSTVDPDATRMSEFVITRGQRYSELFDFLYNFTETSLQNFKLKYVVPYS